ncbi:YafY family protein [Aequorivita todarodis]|uniref:helix-turn-helix transcriptional regulator n=1 Tax=Aequorivita todarodis TaxID=2036821 RepID=UPI0023509627|nr:YafY family protein [Aequorivita todarodis]MDC8001131.1 YafY family protein [Aequorivita todarodis]
MSDAPLNRFDRIVAILIQLQSKKIVKAQELADRFDVSLRTIYRDIRSLESSGVPIISEAGVGYSIMDGYRLPPVMFTREEASSFVAAEKLMQKFTDKTFGAYYESAMFKVKSVLRGKEKDWIDALQSQIIINPAETLFNENIPNALEILFESIAEKRQVYVKYQSLEAEKPSERYLEPVNIFHENQYWYILAYCHFRKDYRQFRTDRLLQIQRTALPFKLEHGTLDDFRKKEKESHKTKVRILVDKSIVKYIKSHRKNYGFVSEEIKKEGVEMTFLTHSAEHGFARWYLMFGDYAEVLEPESLKQRLLKIVENTKHRLSR